VKEIKFRNKREDLDAYYEYFLNTEAGRQLGKSVFVGRLWFTGLVFALLLSLILGGLGYLGFSFRSAVFLALVSLVVMATVFGLLMFGWQPHKFVGKQVLKKSEKSLTEKDFRLLQLPRTIRITDDWLEIRNSEAAHQWRWGLIDAIGVTPQFIFLHIGKCFIYYIPKRDFSSDESFREFGEKLVELQKQHTDQPFATDSVN
jgi:hypothetical protein